MKKIASILFTAIALLFPFILSAQQKQTVQGTVLDESGQPVPGAVVMLDGSTSSATMTDEKGHYAVVDYTWKDFGPAFKQFIIKDTNKNNAIKQFNL